MNLEKKEKNQEDQGEELHGCWRQSAKKQKKGRQRARMFWSLEEVVGIKRGKKWKKKSVRVRVWRRKDEGKKKEKRRRKKCGTCVEDKKKRGEKMEMVSQYFHNIFRINFK